MRLAHGVVPSELLLRKYRFTEFEGLVAAVRCGDLGAYNEHLMTFLDVFVRKGTYLVVDSSHSLSRLCDAQGHLPGSRQQP